MSTGLMLEESRRFKAASAEAVAEWMLTEREREKDRLLGGGGGGARTEEIE